MKIDALGMMDRIISDTSYALRCGGDLILARDALANLLTKIHDLGLIYEAGFEIDGALSELEAIAADLGGQP